MMMTFYLLFFPFKLNLSLFGLIWRISIAKLPVTLLLASPSHPLRKMKPEDVRELKRLSWKRMLAGAPILKQSSVHLLALIGDNVIPSESTPVELMDPLKNLPLAPISTCLS